MNPGFYGLIVVSLVVMGIGCYLYFASAKEERNIIINSESNLPSSTSVGAENDNRLEKNDYVERELPQTILKDVSNKQDNLIKPS